MINTLSELFKEVYGDIIKDVSRYDYTSPWHPNYLTLNFKSEKEKHPKLSDNEIVYYVITGKRNPTEVDIILFKEEIDEILLNIKGDNK